MNFPVFPVAASTGAGQVDALYLFLTMTSAAILCVVFVPLIYCLFKYRRGRRANRDPLRISTTKVEITWTIIPLGLAFVMFGWGARAYFLLEVPPADTLEINVVGKQWMWKIQHEEGNREINELHLPIGRPVKLTLASEDVIHSFYIPAFRIKQDVVPGRFTTLWFEPTRLGRYHLFCAEFCGSDHSTMTGTIIVMTPTAFQDWLQHDSTGETLAASGEKRFRELGCSGCHAENAAVRAPSLDGLYGRWVPLEDGRFVRADERYIRDSILLPNLEITAGYEALMPTFEGRVSDEELFQLIAYVKSLATPEAEETR